MCTHKPITWVLAYHNPARDTKQGEVTPLKEFHNKVKRMCFLMGWALFIRVIDKEVGFCDVLCEVPSSNWSGCLLGIVVCVSCVLSQALSVLLTYDYVFNITCTLSKILLMGPQSRCRILHEFAALLQGANLISWMEGHSSGDVQAGTVNGCLCGSPETS